MPAGIWAEVLSSQAQQWPGRGLGAPLVEQAAFQRCQELALLRVISATLSN